MHYIYLITNSVNGKVYIGQTNDLNVRWKSHKRAALMPESPDKMVISRAITKHGVSNFTFKELDVCETQDQVNILEDQYIEKYDSTNPEKGYNVKRGGFNAPIPEAIRKKISESSMGKPGTNKGKHFDDDWKRNLSQFQIGKPKFGKIRRFSAEEEKEICKLYDKKEKSTYWIGQHFNCNRNVITDVLHRNNVEIRKSNYNKHKCKRKLTEEQELEICRIFKEENGTKASLAKQFGCGKTTIRDILLRNKAI